MDTQRLIKISKYLSKHLRHQPERLGLQLAPGGWVPVADLLAGAARDRFPVTRAELDEVLSRNDKQRFGFDATGSLIRANQGHSVEVSLQLEPREPPDVLYHGTSERSVGAIKREGLRRMRRHHVHLSADMLTAQRVGARHGRPVVYQVDTAIMRRDGYVFYRSENGVWLVEHVPPEYLAPVRAATR